MTADTSAENVERVASALWHRAQNHRLRGEWPEYLVNEVTEAAALLRAQAERIRVLEAQLENEGDGHPNV